HGDEAGAHRAEQEDRVGEAVAQKDHDAVAGPAALLLQPRGEGARGRVEAGIGEVAAAEANGEVAGPAANRIGNQAENVHDATRAILPTLGAMFPAMANAQTPRLNGRPAMIPLLRFARATVDQLPACVCRVHTRRAWNHST